jgi:pilus assembly protein CpaE
MAITNPQVLIVGRDAQGAEELRRVLGSLANLKPVMHDVRDPTLAGDAARTWQPHVTMVQMTGDLSALRAQVRDIRVASPETAIVGVFRPDLFPPDTSESAILIQAIRVGVQDFVRRPVSSHDISQLMDRLLTEPVSVPVQPAAVISFISNKGGIGKSTLAVNVAVGLAQRHPERVLLLDCSLQLGVCATLLGLRPPTTLLDAARERHRLDETLLRQLAVPHACGLDLLAAPANAVEATEVNEEVVSRILSLARRAYDYVVVDSFPVFDQIVMAILDQTTHSYFVLDNLVPTVLGSARMLEVLAGLEFPVERQSIVLNRFLRIAGALRREDVEAKLNRTVDHLVGFDRRVLISSNIGEPFLLRASRFSSVRRSLLRLVDEAERFGHVAKSPKRNGKLVTARPPAESPPVETMG